MSIPPTIAISLWVVAPIALFLAAGWIVRSYSLALPQPATRAMVSRGAPLVLGVVTAAMTWFVWGSLTEPPVTHDEQAYLLQADIFASGHWTGEPPPVPEFFEQTHVFVEPHLASKYPPGHSFFLIPGVWLGLPGFMPVTLSGVIGALLFAIVRRLYDPFEALLAWALWSTSPAALFWRASYFSQTTSTVLWGVALWSLLKWREDARARWLAISFGAIGGVYLTRPLTAIGLALPFLAVVWATRRIGRWQQLTATSVILVPIVALNLLWQKVTVNEWLTSPYALYSRLYFPFVRPGFGVDPTPPLRVTPPEIAWVGQWFLPLHAAHQMSALPAILMRRLLAMVLALGQQWRAFLIVLFLVAATVGRGATRIALLSVLSLFAVYLIYAHPSAWIVYYAEIFPVFYAMAAHELLRFGRAFLKLDTSSLPALVTLSLALMLPGVISDVLVARHDNDSRSAFHRTAARVLGEIREPYAIVFVHYPPRHEHHWSLVTNTPDYRKAPLWVVYDRGEANQRLLRVTDRAAYRLDVERWALRRLR